MIRAWDVDAFFLDVASLPGTARVLHPVVFAGRISEARNRQAEHGLISRSPSDRLISSSTRWSSFGLTVPRMRRPRRASPVVRGRDDS